MHANGFTVPEHVRTSVRDYIVENFLFGDGDGLSNSQSLLEAGAMDSTGIIEMVTWLEETFSLEISDQDLVPDNFDSIDRIARFVSTRTADRPVET